MLYLTLVSLFLHSIAVKAFFLTLLQGLTNWVQHFMTQIIDNT